MFESITLAGNNGHNYCSFIKSIELMKYHWKITRIPFGCLILFALLYSNCSVVRKYSMATKMMASDKLSNKYIIDSHVHIWADNTMPFAFAGVEPPIDLRNSSTPQVLRENMEKSDVKGCIVIQPINYKFDHSYLISTSKDPNYSKIFKFVCLLNPLLDLEEGKINLRYLKDNGFVGIRINPYLFSSDNTLTSHKSLEWFKYASELSMPVGFMCFNGLNLHYDDIITMMDYSPETKVVIDHFGFFLQGGIQDNQIWNHLLSFSKYKHVYVKVSALFRESLQPWPHRDLDSKLVELVNTFGSDRLLFGTDFPFVSQREGGYEYYCYKIFSNWSESQSKLKDTDWQNILTNTAESLYGVFE